MTLENDFDRLDLVIFHSSIVRKIVYVKLKIHVQCTLQLWDEQIKQTSKIGTEQSYKFARSIFILIIFFVTSIRWGVCSTAASQIYIFCQLNGP